MILSKRIALGSTQLDQIDPAIVIRSIDPGVPRETVSAVNRMGGFGQRVTGQHWETLEVSVTYAIDIPKKQMDDRRAVFDKVNKWALGKGWLTVNWMENKRMYVDKVVIPGSGDMWAWTDEYTIVFRAYGVPFWQDTEATTETGGWFDVPGHVETVCNMELVNGSGSTINDLTIQIGESTFIFESLGLADEETLKIGHTDDGILFIRIYEDESTYRSVLNKRTIESSDDLTVTPGVRLITVSAEDVTWTVSCCGRYL